MTPADPTAIRPSTAEVRRFEGNNGEVLERLADSPLLAQGLVNLIVLEPIAERFGARWPPKREAVYEHVERVLTRVSGESAYFARVSETDYLVAHSDIGPFGAQALCLRAFKEIWRHFLGDVQGPELTVHRVSNLSGQEITAFPVDPREAFAGEAREIRAAESRPAADRSVLSPSRWVPFVATDGHRINVSCILDPVYNLKTHTRIGFRLRRQVIDMERDAPLTADQIACLSRSDMLRIDMATMAHGLGRLETETSQRPEFSLIVPLSYTSLAYHASRQMITEALGQARQAVLSGVICEIYDAEDVPHATLAEVISMLRPWSMITAAHLRGMPCVSMKGAGLQAVSASCPAGNMGDAEFIGWLKPWIKACSSLTRSMIIYRCGSQRQLAIAAVLGASHGSVSA